ncbi:MAG TPA: hypothetical protein VN047_07935, partial [Sphingopyxis sp.]|uniref:hypothetical protein n=1 Tax=Sphingopyxis sp. TaxID=1908224 RepID=UPI002B9984FC
MLRAKLFATPLIALTAVALSPVFAQETPAPADTAAPAEAEAAADAAAPAEAAADVAAPAA